MNRIALRSALEWQAELGADEALGEDFIDRTASPAPLPEVPPDAPASHDASTPETLAAAAGTLDALKAAMAAWPHPLRENARNCVFADGNPAARLMIVGEAPGRDEDRQGLPFVGRSGQLLDRMLACIGMDRHAEDAMSAVYIANILPWRPVGNRTPSVEETDAFLPFIDRHIALADPEYVLCMGNVATKTLLNTTTGIMRMRGTWTEAMLGGRVRPVLPSLHPAYLLRQPQDKGKAWQDMLVLQSNMETGP